MGKGEQLFDTTQYEELPVEAMGDHPPITRAQYTAMAEELVEAGHEAAACHVLDTGFNNYTRMIGRAIMDGEMDAAEGYSAVVNYGDGV